MHAESCSFGNLPAVSEDLLLLFITHCYKYLQLKESTIRLYLAGIRFRYIEAGVPNPWQVTVGVPLVRVNLLLRAIKRNQGRGTRPRCAFTADIVYLMFSTLELGVFTQFIDILMQTVVLVAFFGFLRCVEFTVRSYGAFNRDFHLCIEDVSFQGDAQAFLRLKSSKSDQFREGVVIRLFRNDRMCPVQSLKRYVSLRVALHPRPSLGNPLFVTEDNLPLTAFCFPTVFTQTCLLIGSQFISIYRPFLPYRGSYVCSKCRYPRSHD
ncbi:uncharacterized protein LOC102801542 [Saccoglossus kowalevskii]|uniref:Uncharacterized protein LOC102801542 n=1 Tax=Saccoglossus kowalevskii TaxID=10224 RepID=A0ABM0LYX6_SACKO|nr:PREDICTED: uncharacterized protein LOC102801542 [Saccoglossus kowalevskii]